MEAINTQITPFLIKVEDTPIKRFSVLTIGSLLLLTKATKDLFAYLVMQIHSSALHLFGERAESLQKKIYEDAHKALQRSYSALRTIKQNYKILFYPEKKLQKIEADISDIAPPPPKKQMLRPKPVNISPPPAKFFSRYEMIRNFVCKILVWDLIYFCIDPKSTTLTGTLIALPSYGRSFFSLPRCLEFYGDAKNVPIAKEIYNKCFHYLGAAHSTFNCSTIKKSCRALSLSFHPDKPNGSNEMQTTVNTVCHLLKDFCKPLIAASKHP